MPHAELGCRRDENAQLHVLHNVRLSLDGVDELRTELGEGLSVDEARFTLLEQRAEALLSKGADGANVLRVVLGQPDELPYEPVELGRGPRQHALNTHLVMRELTFGPAVFAVHVSDDGASAPFILADAALRSRAEREAEIALYQLVCILGRPNGIARPLWLAFEMRIVEQNLVRPGRRDSRVAFNAA